MAIGQSNIGDLLDSSRRQLKRTVECIYTLVRQRQMDVEFRKRHDDIVDTRH